MSLTDNTKPAGWLNGRPNERVLANTEQVNVRVLTYVIITPT